MLASTVFMLLEQNNRKARHLPEVAHVGSQYGEAQRECCRANQQVCKRNNHALAPLVRIQPTGQQRGFFGVGIHRQISEEFIEKRLAKQA